MKAMLIFTVAWGLAFGPAMGGWMADLWRDPNYGHGLPLLLVVGFLTMRRSMRPAERPGRSLHPWGWLILFAGTSLGIIGWLAAEDLSLRWGGVLSLLGGILLLLPRGLAFTLTPGLLSSLALIPWPYVLFFGLTARLQLFSSAAAAKGLALTGVPLVREGNLLRLPGYQLEVVEACSGMRSLLAIVALGAVVALWRRLSPWQSLLLLAIAPLLALIANAIRLYACGLAAQLAGPEAADHFVHGGGGIMVFVIGSMALAAIAIRMQKGQA